MHKKGQPLGSRTFSVGQYRSGWTSDGEVRIAQRSGKVRLRWGLRPIAKSQSPSIGTQQDRNQAAVRSHHRADAD